MENKKNCKTCNKGISQKQWYLVILSIYILVASVYGTVKIVENIISLF